MSITGQQEVAALLRQIYGIATEKWTMTGKFARIADLSSDALQELGEPDPRYAHLPAGTPFAVPDDPGS